MSQRHSPKCSLRNSERCFEVFFKPFQRRSRKHFAKHSLRHAQTISQDVSQSIPQTIHLFFFVPSSFIPVCVDVTHLHQAGFIYLKQSDLLTFIGIMILLRNSSFMLFNKTINFFNYLDLLIIFFCGI